MSIVSFPVVGDQQALVREYRGRDGYVFRAECGRCGYVGKEYDRPGPPTHRAKIHALSAGHTGEPADRKAQYLSALDRANAVRSVRADFKREVKGLTFDAARGRVADLIRSPGPEWESFPVKDAIRMVPRFGLERTRRIMEEEGVGPLRTLGDLTARQREAVAGLVTA